MTQRGQSIVLIGFAGVGKSSTGQALARKTGLSLLDTDEMISTRFELPVPQVFVTLGEAAFRDAEAEALLTLLNALPGIVVTGGGIVLRPENRNVLRQLGKVICLKADTETLLTRVSKSTPRPMLQTANPRATLLELLRLREPLYQELADVQIDTSALTPDQAADAVLRSIERL